MKRETIVLSVVIPVYNEAAGISRFYKDMLMPAVEKLQVTHEIIFVNDGSKDDTLQKLHQIAASNPNVRVINLSRNCGKETATTAGIHQAIGAATVMLDADGQHPPSMIGGFLGQWNNGKQVVIGVRQSNQKEGFVKKYGSKLFYKISNNFAGTKLTPGATDFSLIDEEVRSEFTKLTEHQRITRGLIDWMGYDKVYMPFHANERLAGEATYSFSKLFDLAINSFVSMSSRPLRIPLFIGIFTMGISATVTMFSIIEMGIGDPLGFNIRGTAFLVLFMLFLIGIILFAQGILALYLAHIHAETQNRPLYIINKKGSIL